MTAHDPDLHICPACGATLSCDTLAAAPSEPPALDRLRGYPVVLYREPEDGSWSVMAPDLPGHCAAAMTIMEAISEAEDAMAAWIASAEADGLPVPPPSDPHEWRLAARLQSKEPGT